MDWAVAWKVLTGIRSVAEPHSATKRSPNMTANCVLAAFHSRDAIFQFWLTSRKTRNSSLDAASSLGKWPRTRTALRKRLCRLSIAFVV